MILRVKTNVSPLHHELHYKKVQDIFHPQYHFFRVTTLSGSEASTNGCLEESWMLARQSTPDKWASIPALLLDLNALFHHVN